MFRATIRADENTNVEAAIADLRIQCERAGLTLPVSEMVAAQTQMVLAPLVERGRQLAAMGSRMHVTREVSGAGFSVKVDFRANVRRGFLERLTDSIRGR